VSVEALRTFQSEAAFQRWVCGLLDRHHWRWHHEVDSRKSKRGLPDIIAIRAARLLFVELKSREGRLTDGQIGWLCDVKQLACHQVEVYIWRPSDMDEIERVLA
jgi:Holliday junction resolvase-like predicted endonuclease